MKLKILTAAGLASTVLSAVSLMFFTGGCSFSQYGQAEGQLKRQEYMQALRSYLRALEPHAREGKRYIYYERDAVTGIGVVYWHMQRYETAIKILRMVTEKDPSYGKAYFYMGLSYEALGDDDNALDAYRNYPEIEPFDPYRQVLVGRFDFLVKRKILHDIELALKNEASLDINQYPEKSVAVYSFLSLSDDKEWEPLQKGLADLVITDLAQVKELKIVERMKLDQLVSEIGLNASALTDPNNSPRLGKLVGARNFVKGSFLVMSDGKMTMDAGLYSFQNVGAPSSYSEDGNLSRLFQMEKSLVLRIIDCFGITLTTQQKEQILQIPTQNLDAFMSYCMGLDALDANDYKSAMVQFEEAYRLDPNFQKAKDWLILPDMWAATHSQNVNRVDRDVAYLTRRSTKGKLPYELQPQFMSVNDRLQWMGLRQNAGFLPGVESRKSFPEDELMGARILPDRLGEPPRPPGE
jgi:tetratricopeptide (TPR) repeat protein